MKIIASYNLKGGVGKTTAAVNLAYLSAQQGQRTLLWDLDPQGAATYLFRIRPRVKGGSQKLVRGSRPILDAVKATDFEGLDLLPADFTYRHMDIDLNGRPKPQQTLRRLLAPLSLRSQRRRITAGVSASCGDSHSPSIPTSRGPSPAARAASVALRSAV